MEAPHASERLPATDADARAPRTLVILRGNSGSGKTTVARAVRDTYGRGAALIEQDYLQRVILREHDGRESTGIAPEFITHTAAFALANGYHVILEGILATTRYARVLRELVDHHDGPSFVYYLDVSFAETVRRHATRPQVTDFHPEQMRGWYLDHDVLAIPGEHVIGETSTFAQTVAHILRSSRLTESPPVTYCPTVCPDCQAESTLT